MKVALREIAHVRAGDKGDTANVAVWLRQPEHWDAICAQLTPERVRNAYPALFAGPVRRHLLPHLCGMNFVLETALEGGVNASLNLDAHGKSFSFLILAIQIELDG